MKSANRRASANRIASVKAETEGIVKANAKEKEKAKEASNTGYSQPVTHASTNPARRSLTSVIGREPVLSTWYGR